MREVLVFDYDEVKKYIESNGIKQKSIAEKAEISEVRLCNILQGNRKCEAGEYVRLCIVLNVKIGAFMKEK